MSRQRGRSKQPHKENHGLTVEEKHRLTDRLHRGFEQANFLLVEIADRRDKLRKEVQIIEDVLDAMDWDRYGSLQSELYRACKALDEAYHVIERRS